ncbi:MAG: hypothetical protein IJV27_04675 [Prevotella sp.]|nr:hypothetical protein [Prevotella sp.]
MGTIKKFCIACLLFVLPIMVFYMAKAAYMMTGEKYKQALHGSEIYTSIDKSKKKTKLKRLIIGDSTANQYFDNREDNDSLYSLACNQAVSVCGHFFLLNNFLQAGNRPQEVYLLFNAFSFKNNLDQIYTYHYFLKPFYTDEYKPLMTPTVLEQIRKVPYHALCQNPLILTSSWAPDYYPEKGDYTFLSPISREYLEKMDSLSRLYDFDFYIVPSVINENLKEDVAHIDRNEFRHEGYAEKLTRFIDNIVYLNDTCFMDGTHLNHPLAYKHLIERNMSIIKEAQDKRK